LYCGVYFPEKNKDYYTIKNITLKPVRGVGDDIVYKTPREI
jgi:hypothetical protein